MSLFFPSLHCGCPESVLLSGQETYPFLRNVEGFSRVMTRPTGRVRKFSKNSWVELDKVITSKSHGSGRTEPGTFQIARVGSGRDGSGRVGSGRIGSR